MSEWLQSVWDYVAYIPCYDGGDSVMAVKKDGQTVMLDKNIKTAMRMILRECSMDINAFRYNFSKSSGRFNLIPVPISLETVLIPLKVRKAIVKNDGSYAYVSMSSIKDVEGSGYCTVTLECGMKIDTMETLKAVKRRIGVGNLVKVEYALKLRGELKLREDISKVITEYGKLANFADIITLILNIFRFGKK